MPLVGPDLAQYAHTHLVHAVDPAAARLHLLALLQSLVHRIIQIVDVLLRGEEPRDEQRSFSLGPLALKEAYESHRVPDTVQLHVLHALVLPVFDELIPDLQETRLVLQLLLVAVLLDLGVVLGLQVGRDLVELEQDLPLMDALVGGSESV